MDDVFLAQKYKLSSNNWNEFLIVSFNIFTVRMSYSNIVIIYMLGCDSLSTKQVSSIRNLTVFSDLADSFGVCSIS